LSGRTVARRSCSRGPIALAREIVETVGNNPTGVAILGIELLVVVIVVPFLIWARSARGREAQEVADLAIRRRRAP
jgi:hypothetical protein